MDFESVAGALQGVPVMSPEQGKRVYDHLKETGARDVLELGTAHGVSSCYMAAAVEEMGGHLTTLDRRVATRELDPQPADVIARAGLDAAITSILIDDSSYNWWLMQKVAGNSDRDGNCSPAYDFVYIDGAHNWTIDGFAVILVEKLLRPGGWLLLDDLQWTYGAASVPFQQGQRPADLGLSQSEIETPHMQRVFDLIVLQHPSFTDFKVEDLDWGWARKNPGVQRRLEVTRSQSLATLVSNKLIEVWRSSGLSRK